MHAEIKLCSAVVVAVPSPLFTQSPDGVEAALDKCVSAQQRKRSGSHRVWRVVYEGVLHSTGLPGVLVDLVIEYHCPY